MPIFCSLSKALQEENLAHNITFCRLFVTPGKVWESCVCVWRTGSAGVMQLSPVLVLVRGELRLKARHTEFKGFALPHHNATHTTTTTTIPTQYYSHYHHHNITHTTTHHHNTTHTTTTTTLLTPPPPPQYYSHHHHYSTTHTIHQPNVFN